MRRMLDCVHFTLSWNMHMHKLQLTSSRADKICGQISHSPLLPLPPLAELNYSDNLALFVVVIITFCKQRSANKNTDTHIRDVIRLLPKNCKGKKS